MIIHVLPEGSVFEYQLKKYAQSTIITYQPNHRRHGLRLLQQIWDYQRQHRSAIRILFHLCPVSLWLVIGIKILKISYDVFPWGGEYYQYILDPQRLESTPPTITTTRQHKNWFSRTRKKLREAQRRFALSWLVAGARLYLGPSELEYRYFRWFARQHYCQSKFPRFIRFAYQFAGTPSLTQQTDQLIQFDADRPKLRVMISHSATPSVHHFDSLALLAAYTQAHSVFFEIHAFISYSGSETERQALAVKLKAYVNQYLADCNLVLHQGFYDNTQLQEKLDTFDLAVFSNLRNEGVTTLTNFVNNGGLVAFKRRSMNYEIFISYAPARCLDHQTLLQTSPQSLRNLRTQKTIKLFPAKTFADYLTLS
jgi:hypothetical protein